MNILYESPVCANIVACGGGVNRRLATPEFSPALKGCVDLFSTPSAREGINSLYDPSLALGVLNRSSLSFFRRTLQGRVFGENNTRRVATTEK